MQVYDWKHAGQNTLAVPRTKDQLVGNSIPVTVTTVDSISQGGINPDFIKIDAENSDHGIIVGAKNTIMSRHPDIIFESGDEGRSKGQTTADTVSLLNDLGYNVYELHHSKLNRTSTCAKYSLSGNLLASKKHF